MTVHKLLVLVLVVCCPGILFGEWQPKQAPLMTKWAKDVDSKRPLPEYPRPQMVRDHWLNLNGMWDYAILPKEATVTPDKWDGQILVPFPVESALSGVMKQVGPDKALWYSRSVSIPRGKAWEGKQVLLHFGAVDWETTVWVNGIKVGEHRGGYDPFSFDITEALFTRKSPTDEIVVRVWDGSDAGYQPRGKQVRDPHGIWYTPTTGIWQTVWLEPVSKTYITSLKIVPDLDAGCFRVTVNSSSNESLIVAVSVFDINQKEIVTEAGRTGSEITLPIPNALLWTPKTPNLYFIGASLVRGTEVLDVVESYSAMRKISLGKDDKGVTRLMLNNKPVFQHGPLDQGFWPDGLYTAPTDEALKFDIEITKQYGFNMIRKHVKVEPARWYYHCDKLGMLVWQDMPSGDKHAQWDPFGKHDNTETTRTKESSDNFNREWKAIIDALRNHPCIVMWVPFNEGWGQANTVAVTKWTKEYDPTRLVNCASGGNDFPVGDVIDVHRYPGPFAPKPTADRAAVLGEYGGLGLPLKGHTWQNEKNWGYRSFTDQTSLTNTYLDLLDNLHPMIGDPGLSAAIYTQTTDVEIEVNGLLTYDRTVQKLPVETLAKAHKALHLPPPPTRTLVESSREKPQEWRYSLERPGRGWLEAGFDISTWKKGLGGFGEKTTPGAVVRTEWKTNDIWLRRDFELATAPEGEVRLLIHHDEDAEVYVNGHQIKSVTGFTTDYVQLRLDAEVRSHFKAGKNTLAVYCKQTGGGQYIDVGFVEVISAK